MSTVIVEATQHIAAPVVTQCAFATALLDPAQPAPTGLRAADGGTAQHRFDVHRNNVMTSLIDALSTTFPVTRALVGDAFFAAMAAERIRVDPPRSPILLDYGDGFAAFIDGFEPAAGVRYLADVARLEALRVQAYHAADAVPLDHGDYHALLGDPLRLAAARLRLHPACHWLSSRYATGSMWLAHQGDDVSRDAALVALDTDIGEDTLVMRPQWDVEVSALPRGGLAWLQALADGATIADALARASAAGPDASAEDLFALLLRHQLVIAIEDPLPGISQ